MGSTNWRLAAKSRVVDTVIMRLATFIRRHVRGIRAGWKGVCINGVLLAGIVVLLSGQNANLRAEETKDYATYRADALDFNTMTMTFNEPFDELDVSAWGSGTRWIAHTPWSGDFGGARFADPEPGFPFTIDDGALTITASRGEDGKWRSGLLASVDPKGQGFSQMYGYFEMRARLPKGPGLWPAFWLIGLDRSQYTAEIDVLEFYGDKPEGYSTVVHVWHKNGDHDSDYSRVNVFDKDDPGDFHTYGVKVDERFIRIYYDRRMVWRTPTLAAHRQPLYMLLNLALVDKNTIRNTPDPSHMVVDYVRAFSIEAESQ